MNRTRLSTVLTMLLLSVLFSACATDGPRDAEMPDRAMPMSITVMTFNVENLFDNEDDPGKDDKAYLPIAAKQHAAHIDACNAIDVERWRNECLYLDWSDATIEHKLSALAESIRRANDGGSVEIMHLMDIRKRAICMRVRGD